MEVNNSFLEHLEINIRLQLTNQNVGYLLGAGASYLNGAGFPLAFNIWEGIKEKISQSEREEIQAKLGIECTEGLEHALDLLDPGGPEPTPHRTLVIDAIARLFSQLTPPINYHCEFVRRISRRNDSFVPAGDGGDGGRP